MEIVIKTEPVWDDAPDFNGGSGSGLEATAASNFPATEVRSPGKEKNVAELERQLATNLTITENENTMANDKGTAAGQQNNLIQQMNTQGKENKLLRKEIKELKKKLANKEKDYLAEKAVVEVYTKTRQMEKKSVSVTDSETVIQTAMKTNVTKTMQFLEEKNTSLQSNVLHLEKELNQSLNKDKDLEKELDLAHQSVVILTTKLQDTEMNLESALKVNTTLKKEVEDFAKQVEASKLNEAATSQRLNFLEEQLQQTQLMSNEMIILRSHVEASKRTLAISESTIGELQNLVLNETRMKVENGTLKAELNKAKDELQKADTTVRVMVEKLADHENTKSLNVKLRAEIQSAKSAFRTVAEKKKRLKAKALKKCKALKDLQSKWEGITDFFRELEEKSAKGQLLSRSDFDTALNYLISSSLTSVGSAGIKRENSLEEDCENLCLSSSEAEEFPLPPCSAVLDSVVPSEPNTAVDSLVAVSFSPNTQITLPAAKSAMPKHVLEKMVKKLKEVSITTKKPSVVSQALKSKSRTKLVSKVINRSRESEKPDIVIIDSDSDEITETQKNSTSSVVKVRASTSKSSSTKAKTHSVQIRKSHSLYRLRRSRSMSKPRLSVIPKREKSPSLIRDKHQSRSCSWTSNSRSRSNSVSRLYCQRESHSSYTRHDYSRALRDYRLSRQKVARSRSRSIDSCHSCCNGRSRSRSSSHHRHHSGRIRHQCSHQHSSKKRMRNERRRSRSLSKTRRRSPSLTRRRRLRSVSVESCRKQSKTSPSKSKSDRSSKTCNSTKPQNSPQNKSKTSNSAPVVKEKGLRQTVVDKSNENSNLPARSKENLEDLLRARLKAVETEREDGECSEHGSEPSNEKNANNSEGALVAEEGGLGRLSPSSSISGPSDNEWDDALLMSPSTVAAINGNELNCLATAKKASAGSVTTKDIEKNLSNLSVTTPVLPMQTEGNQMDVIPVKEINPAVSTASVVQVDSHSSNESTPPPTYLPHEPEFEAHYPAYFGVNENPDYEWLNSTQMQSPRNNIRINNFRPCRRNKMRTQSRVNSLNVYLPTNHPGIVRRNKKPAPRRGNSSNATIPLELNVINGGEVDRDDVVDSIMQKYTVSVVKEIPGYSGKHPIQALAEFCETKKWPPPLYTYEAETNTLIRELNYFCDVLVNNVLHKPKLGSKNKKDAQALAAMYCLQQFGVKP